MSQKAVDILQGIAQAAANAYDGALDDKGEPVKIGLRREEGHLINDSRMLDGFKVKFVGANLCVEYQSEIKLKEVYSSNFESDIEDTVENVASYLKKEYKRITGNSLSLTAHKDYEFNVMVQKTSNVRSWVQAQKYYKIGGMEGVEDHSGSTKDDLSRTLEDGFKKFLDQGGWGTRPKNDKRKKE
jgi:hypothetical protein